ELGAQECGLDPTEQYLLGMLSMLPAMLQRPRDELTPALPLRERIREALDGAPNTERAALAWLESHEHADWRTCDALVQANALNHGQLIAWYAEAVDWA